jgi:hypothetical protein
MFFQLCLSVVLFVVAFSFLDNPSNDLEPYVAIVVTLGAVMYLLLRMVVLPRMTRADDQVALLMTFRTAMFIGIAIAELPVMISICLTFFGAAFPLIVVGAAISEAGLLLIAPSQRVFRLCDERLQADGKAIRMTEAWRHLLTDPPPEMPPAPA